MSKKHKKFEFEDLPKANVVNSNTHAKKTEADELINDAVTGHLNKIVDDKKEDSDPDDDDSSGGSNLAEKTNPAGENAAQTPLPATGIQAPSPQLDGAASAPGTGAGAPSGASEGVASGTGAGGSAAQPAAEGAPQEPSTAQAEPVQGAAEQTAPEGAGTAAPQVGVDFAKLLEEKLSAILPEVDIGAQIAKASAESISSIVKKLHLILPANFEEIIVNGLLEKLKKFYKEGSITLTIHPDRYDFCTKALQAEGIKDRFKDSFTIIKDDTLGTDDCKLEWGETKLEYNQEQLASEIDRIIEQLKSAT